MIHCIPLLQFVVVVHVYGRRPAAAAAGKLKLQFSSSSFSFSPSPFSV
jgi:hypothetical protein